MVEPAAPVDLSGAVAAAQGGDERAFRELFREVQPALLRYLRGLIGEDAEDVASETWLQVCRDLPRFSGDYANFRAWTATIARHRAMDHVRRLRRRPSLAVPVETLADLASGADTESEAADAVATGAAIALVASLPAQQAEAVLLRVVMGLDAETVGRILGKRPGAVRTAAYRGLRRLASMLPEEPA
ncbi:RNA polymerase sigma-70 factor, ECF subfamily [Asanoa hainanensis]|uniref:RNA polymerase sigma-70 factor, ECF subfamily n=1 Tax=Asanoa hainanensis TaxID=560556 RepID=A0A239PC53_9ACTN|nr:RNA polymerase sigma factor [Asanoa hainanensis]SNT64657.1 RNA polymerase sigma-70 factor, ECF subfamily [Asanoa hainanensis]